MKNKEEKYYELDHKKHGVGGISLIPPKKRAQDKKFIAGEAYAVVFFPKIEGIGKAQWKGFQHESTISQSPEAAVTKFMDRLSKSQTWEDYKKAGHRVRRIKIVDMGDA